MARPLTRSLKEQTREWEKAADKETIAEMNSLTLLLHNPPQVLPESMPVPKGVTETWDLDALCVLSPPGAILTPLGYHPSMQVAVHGDIDAEGLM